VARRGCARHLRPEQRPCPAGDLHAGIRLGTQLWPEQRVDASGIGQAFIPVGQRIPGCVLQAQRVVRMGKNSEAIFRLWDAAGHAIGLLCPEDACLGFLSTSRPACFRVVEQAAHGYFRFALRLGSLCTAPCREASPCAAESQRVSAMAVVKHHHELDGKHSYLTLLLTWTELRDRWRP